jgi:hypothetical protein
LAGFCLHNAEGRRIAAFEAALVKHLQVAFVPKSVERKMLKSACLAFEFMTEDCPSVFFQVCFADFSSGNWQLEILHLDVVTRFSAGCALKALEGKP